MKNRYPVMLLGVFLILSLPLAASQDRFQFSKQEVREKLHDAKKVCLQKLYSLEGKSYLWDWKLRKCINVFKHFSTCKKLWSLETKFTKKDYLATIKQVRDFTENHSAIIEEKITESKEPLTKEDCVKISGDIQGMASGCNNFEKVLGERLSELEKLYKEIH